MQQPHNQPKKLVMSQIKNVTNLQELVKYDELFRGYTKKIFDDFKIPTEYSDDIVNDMYLKLNKTFEQNKTVDGGYIVITLKNLTINFINSEFKKNRISLQSDEFEDVNYDEIIEEKLEDEKKYDIIEEKINELKWYEKSVLQLSQKMSLLELSKQSKISYRSLIYTKNKIDEKLGINKKKK